jgi:saccharopepsin
MYTTSLGIGNPPVTFRAQIDTSFGPLFVPSIYCISERCWQNREHLYNPLKSSTSRESVDACQISYTSQFWGLITRGNKTQDSIHVANLEIANKTFESVIEWWPYPLEPDDHYDTLLGLALRDIEDNETTLHTPSLFQTMIDQGLLEDHLFTLRLPRIDEEIGELTLGSIPDYINRDSLVDIPLTHNYDGGDSWDMQYYASNGWQIALNNLTVSSATSTNRPLLTSNYTAVVSTSYPWIVFPWDDAHAIYSQLGYEENVPCDERAHLPNITFIFGPDNKEVTLTQWAYVLEVYNDIIWGLQCLIRIGGMEEEEANGFVLLGNPFLVGLDSVWDAGKRTLSFASRPGSDQTGG